MINNILFKIIFFEKLFFSFYRRAVRLLSRWTGTPVWGCLFLLFFTSIRSSHGLLNKTPQPTHWAAPMMCTSTLNDHVVLIFFRCGTIEILIMYDFFCIFFLIKLNMIKPFFSIFFFFSGYFPEPNYEFLQNLGIYNPSSIKCL